MPSANQRYRTTKCCDTVQLPGQGIRTILEGYMETGISLFSKVSDENNSSSQDISIGKIEHQVEML